jgi:hypothetical protein
LWPPRHCDKRGFFSETYRSDILASDQPRDIIKAFAHLDNASTDRLGYPFVGRVDNIIQQFRAPFTPDRHNDAKLGEVRSDQTNHRDLLADERIACAAKHQAALLRRLGSHEPRVGLGCASQIDPSADRRAGSPSKPEAPRSAWSLPAPDGVSE